MSNKKKNELINPKRLPLTAEKLRELSGLDITDKQAEEVIWALTQYARIIFDFTVQQEESANAKPNQTLDDT
jgi:hypothetical protein